MPGFLVLLFWLWLAVSIGVYAYRFFTKGSLRAEAPGPDTADPADRYAAFEAQLAAVPPPDAPVIADAVEPAAVVADVAPDAAPGFDTFLPTEDLLGHGAAPSTDDEPAVQAEPEPVAVTEPAPMHEPEPVAAVMPAPEPVVDASAPAAEADDEMLTNPSPVATMAAPPMVGDAARAMTLAEALEGIEMPADLIPVRTDQFNPRHMQFVTDTFAPGDVGASLADELERLGFAIVPVSDTAIRVDQSHASVEVSILPDFATIQSVLGDRALEMTPESVVVDFQLC